MPRSKTILQPTFAYNIGARCINRDWFSIPMEDVWNIFSEQLFFIHHSFGVEILAFVLMSNHFHLTLKTPDSNLSEAMQWFMRETSRSLVRAGNRINQTYGGPYFRSILGSNHYFLNAYKYLYYNPVKAGICQSVTDYPFSTLYGLLGKRRLLIPVAEDTILFHDVEGTLDWLNRKPTDENWEAVRLALRKKKFCLPKIDSRNHPLEIDTL